ncbi:MAG: hypothetical protein NTY07_15540 [Bacteroidia bacterium]|nr:hypothetical protein [Bacteroidia bacterium]
MMLALITPVITNAQAGKSNFSGTWALNAEKSTLGDGGGQRMGGGNFVATQEANLLTVVRTRTNQNGEATTTTSKYTLDGKESINTSLRGESKSVATWSADGKTLSIETTMTFNMNGESRTMKMSESWALTDPKVLSIQSSFTTPDGERKSTRVYDSK